MSDKKQERAHYFGGLVDNSMLRMVENGEVFEGWTPDDLGDDLMYRDMVDAVALMNQPARGANMGFGRHQRGVEFNFLDAELDCDRLAHPWHFGIWDYGTQMNAAANHRYEVEIYTKSFALTKPPSWRFHFAAFALQAVLWTTRVVLRHATPDDLPSDVQTWWRPHADNLENLYHIDDHRYHLDWRVRGG